jgi:hypothetical protein
MDSERHLRTCSLDGPSGPAVIAIPLGILFLVIERRFVHWAGR